MTAVAPGRPVAPAGTLVSIDDLKVHYPTSKGLSGRANDVVRAVDGVTLSIEKGQTLGLVGGTGSGKSTIAQVIMGMVAPTSGSVTIAGHRATELQGKDLQAHRRTVQVVMQDPYSSLDPRMKVRDIIAEPLTLGRPFGGRNREVRERVAELLVLVGLSASKADLYPHQFSGGQRQRIAIARALAPRPDIIVLDEPTSALDVSVRAQILNLLKALQQQLGVTYLMISHDLVSVAYLASTVAVMTAGKIVELGPTTEIFNAPRHPYTFMLQSSAPTTEGRFIRVLQPATNAALADLPATACRFASRCDLRRLLGEPARCLEADPELRPIGPEHAVACHFAEEVERLAIPAPDEPGETARAEDGVPAAAIASSVPAAIADAPPPAEVPPPA